MRILFATESYRPDVNGAAYFVQRLAARLLERGHEVAVICPSLDRRSSAQREDGVSVHRVASVPVPLYGHQRCSPIALAGRPIHAVLARVCPDVVHVQNHFLIGRAITRIAHRTRVPLLATNHFVPENFLVQLEFLPRPLRALLRDGLWRDLVRVYSRSQCVTAPTPYATGLLSARGMPGHIQAVSCGVDLRRFAPGPDPAGARRSLGIAERPTAVFVGRLDPEKHIERLINALALVRSSVDAQLLIAGQGKHLPALRAAARRAGVGGHVIFTGYVADDELPTVYAAGDVYCNPGTAELQSIATLEAMACAKPVLLARAMALPHLVREGVNGHTFTPEDTGALARQLAALLCDPRACRTFGAASRRLVASGHGLDVTADSYEALYLRLAGRSIATTAALPLRAQTIPAST